MMRSAQETSYDVRVWKTEKYQGRKHATHTVRWSVADARGDSPTALRLTPLKHGNVDRHWSTGHSLRDGEVTYSRRTLQNAFNGCRATAAPWWTWPHG